MTQIDKIKKLLDQSLIFEDDEKQEWRGLLVRMSAKEIQEFYQILVDEVLEFKKRGIEMIADKKQEEQLLPQQEPEVIHGASLKELKQQVEHVAMTPQEIKRELSVPEISAPPKVQTSMPAPRPAPVGVKEAVAIVSSRIQPSRAAEIKTLDDLKNLSVEFLRKGRLTDQTNLIRSKIFELANTYKMFPYHMVAAFEQSPLFRAYLIAGNKSILAGPKSEWDSLSKEEFEALADLRKQIENI